MKIKCGSATIEVKLIYDRKEDKQATMAFLNTLSIALDNASSYAEGNGWVYNAATYDRLSGAIYKALQEADYYVIKDDDV